MYTMTWLSLLKMGGMEEADEDVLSRFYGCTGGPNGPHPALIAAIVCSITYLF